MTDPAIAAAQRVCEKLDQHATAFIPDISPWHFRKLCAREALAPIRDRLDRLAEEARDATSTELTAKLEEAISDLVTLAYRPEELEAHQ